MRAWNNYKKGKAAEKVAIRYLKNLGYRILVTNYRTKLAEIDIIALHKGCLVVLEVKRGQNIPPCCRVDMQKRKRILQGLEYFLFQHQMHDYPIHFEVIAIVMPQPDVRHFTEEFFDF